MKYGRITAGKEGFGCQGWSLFYFSSVDGWNPAQYELRLVVYPVMYRVLQTLPWWWLGISEPSTVASGYIFLSPLNVLESNNFVTSRLLCSPSRWWKNHRTFSQWHFWLQTWINDSMDTPPFKRLFTAGSSDAKSHGGLEDVSFRGVDPPMRTKKTSRNGSLLTPQKKNITQKNCIFNNASWNPKSHPQQKNTSHSRKPLFFENP